ncbi:MAG: DUF3857 domain-containing protein [Caulobacterales bacterium]
MIRLLLVLWVCLWTGVAVAADQPQYGPPAAWVKQLSIPATAPKDSAAAIQVLLEDVQTNFSADGDLFYTESAFRIVSPAGLAFASAIAPSWNPETETLTFHRLNIVRGGQVIDLLAGGKKVTVLRRETNLELAMLDGDLTATVQPEGLQVGDIVDMAITLQRRDPVFQGRSESFTGLQVPGVAARFHVRALWPPSKPMRWRTTDGLTAPAVTKRGDGTQLDIDLTDVTTPKPPAGAPARFHDLGQMELSQFASWSEVSSLMAPLYEKAATLAPDSPVRLEAQKIRDASSDPKTRAIAALRLVQDKVRYEFIGMNFGGYVPAEADVTWARRFGDCKGKTTLLLALLNQLGIEAEPALVSTFLGDGLDSRLPMLGVFNHVFVRARIDGKIYWLDGTRTGDRSLDDIQIPDFHWVLPVRRSGGQLEDLTPAAFDRPTYESFVRYDASAGYDQQATVHADHVFRGDDAVAKHLSLDALGKSDAERSLREYWRSRFPSIDTKSVDFTFDDARREMRYSVDGSMTMEWNKNAGVRDFDISESSLGFRPSFRREPGLQTDAPYAVEFPSYDKWTVVIVLPDKGAGFSLMTANDVDQTIAGRRYQRNTRMENGVVTMTASERSLEPEFPASEAGAAEPALRQLNAYDVTVRGPGTPVPTEKAADEPPAKPTTAAEFMHSGDYYLAKRDFDHAIANFDQAVRLDPNSAKGFYNRGVAHLEKGQDDLALADFNQALRLKPFDPLAHEARAQLYLFRNEDALADKDFDEATQLSPPGTQVLLRHARAYESAGKYEGAIRIYDQMIADSPNDADLLNGRCWLRAEWGEELQRALDDCNSALKIVPESSQELDSRGLTQLRLGRLDLSISDYDEALRISPNQGASLFGRGVAKLRKGDKPGGEADIAAALAKDPQLSGFYARIGVKP